MFKKIFESGIFWTIVVGLFGVVVTMYLSKSNREIVYTPVKEASKIYDSENSISKIKVLANDSVVIKNNVYIANFLLWNNGKKEIMKKDVRKKIKFEPVGNAEILDYKIVAETHSDISNFEIVQNGQFLVVDWDYFDPKFGFEIQIIYSGSVDSNIVATGYILGSEVKKVKVNPKNTLENKIIAGVILLFFAVLGFLGFKTYSKEKDKKELPTLIGVLLFIILGFYFYFKELIFGYTTPFT